MQRFEFWKRAVADTADAWSHVARLLRESQQETLAHGAVGELAVRAASEAATLAAAADECADQLSALVGDVATAEARVVADVAGLLRHVTER